MPGRDLFLITGVPGTGKTWYGNKFAEKFGFGHHDLEDQQTLNRFATDPAQFIRELVNQDGNVVVTWGFLPDHIQTGLVLQFRSAGFKLIWFDGNRNAALKKYEEKSTASATSLADFYARMYAFYLQMSRIENTKVVEQIKPAIIDSFDAAGQFKPAAQLLQEIRNVK